jgi:hypothetical protein
MPRCSQCARLVSIEATDFEVNNLEFSDNHVTADVRIVNTCAECSSELKASEFEVDAVVELEHEHEGDEEASYEAHIDVDRTEREHPPRTRRRKKFYGVQGEVWVECTCGWESPRVGFEDEVQASGMDDA